MNTKKFSEAMTGVDDKYYEEAAQYEQKRKSPAWLKWCAMAACLCLLIIGAINAGNLFLWRSGCGQTSYNVTLADGRMYCIHNNSVYLYETNNSTQKKLADFNGVLTRTRSGLYLMNEATGEVYLIFDSTLSLVESITPDSILIDVLDDKIYYRTYQNDGAYSVMEKDLTEGTISEVISVSEGHMIAQKIINDELYYCTTENGGIISAVDIQTKEDKTIYKFPGTNEINMNSVVFFDDFILIKTEQGLYSMGYNDTETTFLSEYVPTTGALDYFNNKLYFVVAFPLNEDDEAYEYTEELISLNVQTGEISTVTQLTNENGTTQTYTEIVVCDSGYFYTEPSATEGGLFFHSFNQTEEVKIFNN